MKKLFFIIVPVVLSLIVLWPNFTLADENSTDEGRSQIIPVEVPIDISPEDMRQYLELDLENANRVQLAFFENISWRLNEAKKATFAGLFPDGMPANAPQFEYTINGEPLPKPETIYISDQVSWVGSLKVLPAKISSNFLTSILSIKFKPPVKVPDNTVIFKGSDGKDYRLVVIPINYANQRTNWSESEKQELYGAFRKMAPQIVKVAGLPVMTKKEKAKAKVEFKVAKVLGEKVASHRGRAIWMPQVEELTNFDDTKNGSILLHEILHAWRGPKTVSTQAIEEGVTVASQFIVSQKLGVKDNPDWLPLYEQFNRPEMTPSSFYAKEGGGTSPDSSRPDRYTLAGVAFRKIYLEDNNFFRKFNKEAAKSGFLGTSGRGLPQLEAATKNRIEGLPVIDWLKKQYALDFAQPRYGVQYFPQIILNNRHSTYQLTYELRRYEKGKESVDLTANHQFAVYKNHQKDAGRSIGPVSVRKLINLPELSLTTDRYTKFTYQSYFKGYQDEEEDTPPPQYNGRTFYYGASRPYLWGIINKYDYTPRDTRPVIKITPLDPKSGKTLKPTTTVKIINGIFESPDHSYGKNAGTYKIEYLSPGCAGPITRVITKPAGEYYIFIDVAQAKEKFYPVQFSDGDICPIASIDLSAINVVPQRTSAKISMATGDFVGGFLEYGLTADYTDTAIFEAIDNYQSIELNNLVSGQTYHYKITALNDREEWAQTGELTFETQKIHYSVQNKVLTPPGLPPDHDKARLSFGTVSATSAGQQNPTETSARVSLHQADCQFDCEASFSSGLASPKSHHDFELGPLKPDAHYTYAISVLMGNDFVIVPGAGGEFDSSISLVELEIKIPDPNDQFISIDFWDTSAGSTRPYFIMLRSDGQQCLTYQPYCFGITDTDWHRLSVIQSKNTQNTVLHYRTFLDGVERAGYQVDSFWSRVPQKPALRVWSGTRADRSYLLRNFNLWGVLPTKDGSSIVDPILQTNNAQEIPGSYFWDISDWSQAELQYALSYANDLTLIKSLTTRPAGWLLEWFKF